MLLDCHWNQ